MVGFCLGAEGAIVLRLLSGCQVVADAIGGAAFLSLATDQSDISVGLGAKAWDVRFSHLVAAGNKCSYFIVNV